MVYYWIYKCRWLFFNTCLKVKKKASKYGYRLNLFFTLTQHEKSKETLHDIQNYFQCGKCLPQHKNCINYTVSGKVTLYNSVIPHFKSIAKSKIPSVYTVSKHRKASLKTRTLNTARICRYHR